MDGEKSRHTLWLTETTWKKVKDHYREDNCTTQNEFVEKALLFYMGYLDTKR